MGMASQVNTDIVMVLDVVIAIRGCGIIIERARKSKLKIIKLLYNTLTWFNYGWLCQFSSNC